MLDDIITTIKRIFTISILLGLAFIFAIFILQNLHEVKVYFDLLKTQDIPYIIAPVWLLTFCAMGIGIIVGMFLMWVYESDLRENFEQTKEKQTKLEKDMSKLKTNISKTIS